jgi:hypothetical protein
VTALALGMRVVAMSLGGGLRTKVLSWRDTFVILGASPVEGLVVLSPETTRHYRAKMALVLLAGPITNALGAAVGFALLGEEPLTLGSGLPGLWIAVNFLMIWPMSTRGSFGQLSSDGQQLLGLLKIAPADVDKVVRNARLVEPT